VRAARSKDGRLEWETNLWPFLYVVGCDDWIELTPSKGFSGLSVLIVEEQLAGVGSEVGVRFMEEGRG